MKQLKYRGISAIMICSTTITAFAQLDPDEQLLEAMKEIQAHQSLVIGRTIGPDPGTVLNFAMSGSVANGVFTFSTHGQSYRGAPIDIDCIGTRNGSGDQWTWSSVGTCGSESWQLDGTSVYDFSAARPLATNSLMNRGPGKPKPDEHSGTIWNGPFSTTWTIHTLDGIVVGESISFDFRIKLGFAFDWNHRMDSNPIEDKLIGTYAEGSWDSLSGTGNFNMQIVPEPAGFASIALGFIAIFRKRRR